MNIDQERRRGGGSDVHGHLSYLRQGGEEKSTKKIEKVFLAKIFLFLGGGGGGGGWQFVEKGR